MKAGAPKDNKNAEIWTIKEAKELFKKGLEMTNSHGGGYDFIGEVARDLGHYKQVFYYLSDKYPELKSSFNKILSNCEANCYTSGKTGKIIPSLAIMNLKSNHGWTDRVDNTTKGDAIQPERTKIVFKSFKDGGGE